MQPSPCGRDEGCAREGKEGTGADAAPRGGVADGHLVMILTFLGPARPGFSGGAHPMPNDYKGGSPSRQGYRFLGLAHSQNINH